jgi:hypothetical protein
MVALSGSGRRHYLCKTSPDRRQDHDLMNIDSPKQWKGVVKHCQDEISLMLASPGARLAQLESDRARRMRTVRWKSSLRPRVPLGGCKLDDLKLEMGYARSRQGRQRAHRAQVALHRAAAYLAR